jgi:site-specific recombinase XerD
MDGKRVPGAASGSDRRRSRKKRSPGLRVEDRGGYWHVRGTVRAKGRSKRLRESTGLRATAENFDAAEKIRLDYEAEYRDQVVHGKRPSVPVPVAADQFLESRRQAGRPYSTIDARRIQAVTERFHTRAIGDLADSEWDAFIADRCAGLSASTRERWLAIVVAFLNWCASSKRRWIDHVPEFDRNKAARKPRHRRARRVAEFTPRLIQFIIARAAPHIKGQLAVEWSTGARVSSVLHHCRLRDLVLAPGRSQITFSVTKNGDPVTASLHTPAAELIAEYLQWRGDLQDRDAPLFVTDVKDPRTGKWRAYSRHQSSNRVGFNGMKRRAARDRRAEGATIARALRRQGDRAGAWQAIYEARREASLIAEITQHWFRHNLATQLDLRSAMEQGGWRDITSVMGYKHDIPERRRADVEKMATDADEPIAPAAPAKKA